LNYEDFICIGKTSGCSGIKGLLKITPFTDFPERFLELKRVYLFDEKKSLFVLNHNDSFEFKIEKCDVIPSQITLKLEGINSKEEAGEFVNLEILVPEGERVKLPEGKYFHYEIIGFEVFNNDELLGRLQKIENFGSDDLMNVKTNEGKEILIPYRNEFVKNIDVTKKRIDVHLIEGFLD
jgi:16S rRNA processing protein RimM